MVAFSSYLPGGPDDESEVSFETFKGSVGGPSSKDRVYFFYNAGTNVPTFAGAAVENHPGGPQSLVMSELVFDEQTGTAEFRSTYAGGPNFDQASRMARPGIRPGLNLWSPQRRHRSHQSGNLR